MFGSVARGDDGPGSDIDLLVTFPPEADIVTLLTLDARHPNELPRLSAGQAVTADAPASMPLPDGVTSAHPSGSNLIAFVSTPGSATREGTSDCVVTLSHVSTRIGSEFGTLGERLAATKPKPAERPVAPARHVWVQTPSGRQAGLLVAWVTGADGTWWGRVAVSDAPGEASLQLLDSSLLAPASTESAGE